MAYTPANGLNINGNFVTEGVYAPAHGLNIIADFSTSQDSKLVRALIEENGIPVPIKDSYIGTGKIPLVFLDGKIVKRVSTEGTPLVLHEDRINFRTMRVDEELII